MQQVVLINLLFTVVYCNIYSSINLPDKHLPLFFSNNPRLEQKCKQDETCAFKSYLNSNKYWGYEQTRKNIKRYSMPICPGDHKGWVENKSNQIETFYTQADFGYIKQQLNEMKLYCEPLYADDSLLECSDHLRFCRGRNIQINFTNLLKRTEPIRYKMDVLSMGQIGGYCDFKEKDFNQQLDHISPLQSWGPELRYFTKLEKRPIIERACDVVIEKPTFIMKIDATVNMYHHFCDFFNLYASLHLNATLNNANAFSTDVHILIWETYAYKSAFGATWEAFTRNPIWNLNEFRGKNVCFRNIVFPLLPRMIFGLYYNTPIIYGCENSGLFDAFAHHILHRLKIPLLRRDQRSLRITFISRNTNYRNVINQNELIESIEANGEYKIKTVEFSRDMPFKEQLEITRNTDILIGMHGAGLTHLLFLPEWATVFELYHCEDPNCYMDLARLKGVGYITWEKVDKLTTFVDGLHKGGAQAKFANYTFDKSEFLRLVAKAATQVKNHPSFNNNLHQHTEL